MSIALIVDDSVSSSARLKQYLFRRGISSVRVESVAEALAWIERQVPQLVMMADLMPGKPGFAATRKLKESERTKDIPVVMYSAHEDKIYVGQAIALGAEDVLVKPVSQSSVDAVLERLRRKGLLLGGGLQPLDAVLEPRPKLQGLNLLPWALCSLLMIVGSYAVFEKSQANILERSLLGALQQAMNFSGYYAFDELPYGLEKQERIKSLLRRLAASGFDGQVEIVEHQGEFCMVNEERAGGGYALVRPVGDIALSNCYVRDRAPILSYPMVGQIRDDFHASLRDLLKSLNSNIELVYSMGDGHSVPFHYPDAEAYTVGSREWNETAALNNQVQVIIKNN